MRFDVEAQQRAIEPDPLLSLSGSHQSSRYERCLPRCSAGLALRMLLQLIVVGAVVMTVDWAIHNYVCDFLFKCGCRAPWAGSWDQCNVHNPTGPRCPWCLSRESTSWTTDWLVRALTVVAFFVGSYTPLATCCGRFKRVDADSFENEHIPLVESSLAAPEDSVQARFRQQAAEQSSAEGCCASCCALCCPCCARCACGRSLMASSGSYFAWLGCSRLLFPTLVYFATALVVGFFFYISSDYPYFLWS